MRANFRYFFAVFYFSHSYLLFAQTSLDTRAAQAHEAAAEVASKVLFDRSQVDGAAGSIHILYVLQPKELLSGLSLGADFYYLFANHFQLGISGGIINSLVPMTSLDGFMLGGLGGYFFRFDPLLININNILGFSSINSAPGFMIFPQVSLGLRIMSDFALNFSAGYMIFFDKRLASDLKVYEFWLPNVGIYLTFGAF